MGEINEILQQPSQHALTIIYHDNKVVNFGTELTPSEVINKPQIQWPTIPENYYTLLMFDPDAPSYHKPLFANILHWLIVNIPGTNLNGGETIIDYHGSKPPKRTDFHRYIFVVFEHRKKIDSNELRTILRDTTSVRLNFDLDGFMKKYDFNEVCAFNYFKAKWDDSVQYGFWMSCFLNFILGCHCCFRPCFKKTNF